VSRDPLDRLRDVKENLDRVVRLTKELDFDSFVANEAVYFAVVYSLGIVGEAVKSLPDETKRAAPNVDWKSIGRLRDLLFHAYFGISNEIIWQIVTERVPDTLLEVNELLSSGSD